MGYWLLALFVCLQIGLLVFAWRKLSTEDNAWHTRTNAWASILTVFGIFGTFIGIFLGLWGFEVTNIEGSIGPLLEGLKLAFLTSIVGIGSALGLRFVALSKTRDEDDPAIRAFVAALAEVETSGENNLASKLDTLTETVEEEGQETQKGLDGIKTELTEGQCAMLNQLAGLTSEVEKNRTQLTQLTQLQNKNGKQTRQTLKEMETAISEKQDQAREKLLNLTAVVEKSHTQLTRLQNEVADKTRQTLKEMETTIAAGQNEALAQLRILTTTFAEKHELLVGEFRTFSQNVADSIAKLATEELIEALKTVIEDFNTKISEQFGDNFKQLNEAVGRTVEWQEQYRQQMSELISQMSELIGGLGDAAETFEQARSSLKDIAESSRLIAEQSDSIVTCAKSLETILPALNTQLEAFNGIQRSLEQTQTRIVTLTEQLGDRIRELNSELPESMRVIAQLLVEGLEPFAQDYIQFTGQLRQFIEELRPLMGMLRNIRPDDEIPF